MLLVSTFVIPHYKSTFICLQCCYDSVPASSPILKISPLNASFKKNNYANSRLQFMGKFILQVAIEVFTTIATISAINSIVNLYLSP